MAARYTVAGDVSERSLEWLPAQLRVEELLYVLPEADDDVDIPSLDMLLEVIISSENPGGSAFGSNASSPFPSTSAVFAPGRLPAAFLLPHDIMCAVCTSDSCHRTVCQVCGHRLHTHCSESCHRTRLQNGQDLSCDSCRASESMLDVELTAKEISRAAEMGV